MLIARSCQQRRQPSAFRRRLAPALSTISAVLTAAALVCPVAAEQGAPMLRYDRRVLSETAQDVLRRAASGPDQPVARVSLPTRQPDEGVEAAGSAADLAPPATDIAPVQAGTIVKIAPGTPAPGRKTAAPTTGAAGYQSNSWRQRSDTARGLSFSSGVLAPASGLDPALAAHADGLRAEGHEFVYGFVLLRVPARRGAREEAGRPGRRSSSGPTTITTRPGCPSDRSRRSPRCPRSSGSGSARPSRS